jgi:hypothetical protein
MCLTAYKLIQDYYQVPHYLLISVLFHMEVSFNPLNLLNFLHGLAHLPVFKLSIINLGNVKMKILKLVRQQYRAWSNYTDVLPGLALYWWQRLITGFQNSNG